MKQTLKNRSPNIGAAAGAAAGTGPAEGAGITVGALSAQYHKAVSGLREMVICGAMLLEVESCLTRETAHANQYSGETLKGWLGEHCPEINYKTAMRFKTLAAMLHEHCKVPKGGSLARLLTGARVAPDDLKSKRAAAEAEAMIDGRSARQLMFSFASANAAKGGDLGGAGKKVMPTLEQRQSLSWQVGLDFLQGISTWARGGAPRLLDAQQRTNIAAGLRDLAREIEAAQ